MDRRRLRPALLAPFVLLLAFALSVACGDDDSSNADATSPPAGASETSNTGMTPTTPAGHSGNDGASSGTPGATETVGGRADPPAAFDDATDPLRMMNSYYNAINRHEYQRAYDYWREPPQSFEDFRQGYAQTAYSTVTLESASGIDAAAGNRHTLVAAVIRAQLNDGTEQRFAGCYALWRAAEGVSEDAADSLWHIEEARIAEMPDGQTMRAALDSGCEPWADRVANYGQAYDNRTGSVNVIYSLYDAINRKEYRRAYDYWESPPQSFEDLENGYAKTTSTTVTVGTPANREGAAGSVYEEVPVVLHAMTTGGEEQRFAGCYVVRRSNLPSDEFGPPENNPWAIYSANIAPAAADADVAGLLRTGCDSTP